MKAKQRVNPFTLVELLVVIGVIAILAAILLPALKRARDTASSIVCVNNERQLYQAFLNYNGDHEHLPYSWSSYLGSLISGQNVPWTGTSSINGMLGVEYLYPAFYKNSNGYYYVSADNYLSCPSANNGSRSSSAGLAATRPDYAMNQTGIGGFLTGGATNKYAKLSQVPHSSQQVAFSEYLWRQDPPHENWQGAVTCFGTNHQSGFFAHNNSRNYLFCDGHVKAVRSPWVIENTVGAWYLKPPYGNP